MQLYSIIIVVSYGVQKVIICPKASVLYPCKHYMTISQYGNMHGRAGLTIFNDVSIQCVTFLYENGFQRVLTIFTKKSLKTISVMYQRKPKGQAAKHCSQRI